MKTKKKLIIVLAALAIAAVSAGVGAIAATSYGTKDDPLVTLSYLDESVIPRIKEELGGVIDEKAAELEGKLAGNPGGSQPQGGESVDGELRFSVVSLSSGQTLSCSVGTEIMLRIGTAQSWGSSSPRLIDETTGASVASAGAELSKDHMYIVTIKGNGIKATSKVKVLVRGSYTIG